MYGAASEPQAIRAQAQTTRRELLRMAEWLHNNGCRHIAVESTGVYWRPVYETIEAQSPGYACLMVMNAHHMRNLPGRKSDVKDAEWIATLLRYGLLENSFIPARTIRDLREFVRLRRIMVQERNRHINRPERAILRLLLKRPDEVEGTSAGRKPSSPWRERYSSSSTVSWNPDCHTTRRGRL